MSESQVVVLLAGLMLCLGESILVLAMDDTLLTVGLLGATWALTMLAVVSL